MSPTPYAECYQKQPGVSVHKYGCTEATAYSHSADAKLPRLPPAATISVPLSACVLKSTTWRTKFVAKHT